jgi:hypothetical protein
MECTLKLFLKSAVAFFFLFFFHGISIGSGQQGISYNGAIICVRWGVTPPKIINSTKL